MCPYKTVHTRKKKTPWVTQEIYSAIRKKQRLIIFFKSTGDLADLRLAKIQRNFVNSLIYKAKRNYIVNSLNLNVKKTKKFWRIIKDMVDDDEVVDITSFVDRDLYTNIPVKKIDVRDYLNEYFVKIAERTRERPNDIMNEYVECYENVMSTFDFIPPAIEEIYGYE